MKKQEPQVSIQDACRWACWVFDNTDMPKRKVLQRAAQRFGVTAKAVERAIDVAKGPDYLSERSERMLQKYRSEHSAESCQSARSLRPYRSHWKIL
ncbi:MAG: hypothetical protein AB7T01_02060 [Acidithiobacillus sp.]